MDEPFILEMCKRLSWKAKARGKWVQTSCPFARDKHEGGVDDNPSFGISINPDSESTCYCLACGTKLKLSALATALEFGNFVDTDEADLIRHTVGLSERFSHKHDSAGYLVDRAPELSEYTLERFQRLRKVHIQSRGITEQSAVKFELQWDRSDNRILFPIRDEEGRLVGLRGRYIGPKDENKLRYRDYVELSPSGKSAKKFGVWYGINMPMSPDKALILVEGEIDLIRLKQVLPKANAIASIGASIAPEQLRSLQIPRKGLILFFDNDMAGKRAAQAVIAEAKRREEEAPIYKVTDYSGCNDPDEIVGKGGQALVIKTLSSLDKVH